MQRRQHTLSNQSKNVTPLATSDLDYSQEKQRRNYAKASTSVLRDSAFFACLLVSFVALCTYSHFWLPSPVPETAPLNVFSEQRARKHLGEFQRIGWSMTGTKNNEMISEYVIEQVNALRNELVGSGRVPNQIDIEVDRQIASGALEFSLMEHVMTNVYSNLTNVVVRVSFGEASRQNAVLINTHTDTPIGSPGAVDARVCAVNMLETLRAIVHDSSVTRRNAFIFLFNGAEESLQEGSHAFITKHKWRETVRTVLNLDAGGNSGPEILFQSGPLKWVQAYGDSAAHPHGSVLAQDIFSSGILQSDTDYRVFRDFGNVEGLDLCYYANSYWYHTALDTFDNVQIGMLQHEGDNILAYLNTLGAMEHLAVSDSEASERAVYFDIVRTKFVRYSMRVAFFVHFALIVGTLAMQYSLLRILNVPLNASLLSAALLPTTLMFVAPLLVCPVVGFLLSLVNPLAYYTHTWLVTFLFGLPSLCVATLCLHLSVDHTMVARHGTATIERLRMMAANTIACTLLALTTVRGVGSSYIYMCIVVANLYALYVDRAQGQPLGWFSIALSWLPMILVLQSTISFLAILVPITGRMGVEPPSDVIVGAVCGLSFAHLFLIGLPIVHARVCAADWQRARSVSKWLIVLSVTACLASCFVFPYDKLTPKRLFVQHGFRVGESSAHPTLAEPKVLVTECDAVGLDSVVSAMSERSHLGFSLEFTDEEMPHRNFRELWELDATDATFFRPYNDYVDLDTYYPFNFFLAGYALPSPPLGEITTAVRVGVLRDDYDESGDRRHLHLIFYADPNEFSTVRFKAPLLSWSLGERLPEDIDGYYFIRHVGGRGVHSWELELVLKGREPVLFEMSGLKFGMTEYMNGVVSLLPEWTTEVCVIGIYSQEWV